LHEDRRLVLACVRPHAVAATFTCSRGESHALVASARRHTALVAWHGSLSVCVRWMSRSTQRALDGVEGSCDDTMYAVYVPLRVVGEHVAEKAPWQ